MHNLAVLLKHRGDREARREAEDWMRASREA
jgi:hypothetical protein